MSFCTDLSSEMIVPLLPAFVATLGAGPAFLGLLEGMSTALVAVLRLWAGARSDRTARRPWVLAGYGLSGLARPLMALAATPIAVLGVRLCDRVGKGIRSAPRDALLADVVAADMRGRAFGLLRGMDHGGALGGAAVAAGLLALGCSARAVFALAAAPAVAALLLLWLSVREPVRTVVEAGNPGAERPGLGFRPFLVVASLSAFGGVLDLQLLFRAEQLGVDAGLAPMLWMLLHVTRALLAPGFGRWSDRVGRRKVIAWGLVSQVFVLAAFGLASAPWQAWCLFALHGVHAACTEGAERGLVADLSGGRRGGRAFGLYHLVSGLAVLPLAISFGWLYERAGAQAAFLAGTALPVTALALLLAAVPAAAGRATRS